VADFLKLTLGITMEAGLRYLIFAGAGWVLGYMWFKRRWFSRKIVAHFPERSQAYREALYSARSVLIFAVVGALTVLAIRRGWTQMPRNLDNQTWNWFFASVAINIAIHDTYFYWTHRLMHHRWLYKWFHQTHHLSTNPTPWAAYAFSPLEAVVQAGIFPLIAFTVPIHPLSFVVFMFWQILFNVIGHTGYEFYPSWLVDSWLGKFLNTPTAHILHHESFRDNYGIYFNVWDRLMGTNHERYSERFREVTTRSKRNDPLNASKPVEVLSAE